jgi:hypothetical protein
MSVRERVYRFTDKPMSWTRAIVVGTIIWVLLIMLTGQLPSWIIYTFDAYPDAIIDFSKKVPGVSEEGLNSTQIKIVRDIVANSVQMGFFTMFLVAAYFWQKKKQRRLGLRGPQDTVKGYLSGK